MKVLNYQRWMIPNVTSQIDLEFDLLDVLTKDDAGCYAVYRTIIDRATGTLEDWFLERCAGRGNKLCLDIAIHSFPFLALCQYRD